MNFFALLSFLACTLAVFSAFSIYTLDRKKPLNRIYAVFALFLAYWCFTEFMYRQAESAPTAYFWMKLQFIWPLPTVLTFHFALVFTEKIKHIKKATLALFLYGPAVVFSLIYLATDWITTGVVLKFWGYTYVTSESWVSTASNTWAFVLTSSAIFICFRYYQKTKEEIKKQQAKYVTLGFLIPVCAAFFIEGLLPWWNWEIPEISTISTHVLAFFVGYAVRKYQLFTLNPATAAETIITTMSEPLLLADQKGKILKVNQALTRFLGVPEKNLVGKSMHQVLKEQNIRGVSESPAPVLQKLEVKFTTKTNEEKHVLVSSSPVLTPNGQTLGTVYIIHDITELKQLEARLLKSERFAAIGELSGMVGHDLRNPLTGIKNAAYFLKKKGNTIPEAQAKEMFEVIESCIDHSNKIISDLLDYSKEINLDLEETSPRQLIEQALQHILLPENIKVKNLTRNEPQLRVDPDKLGRVFVNLIKNAADAMPAGGNITIDAQEREGKLEISFTDTGTGIPDNVLPKLFMPLFTTKAQGMGFGLAICKRIVEEHGGTIAVETTVGEGSTFKVTLPIKQNASNGPEWAIAGQLSEENSIARPHAK